MNYYSLLLIVAGLSFGPMPSAFAASAQMSKDYVVGPGDILAITDNEGVVTKAPVLPNGTAVVGYAGVIEAASKSIEEISKLVNESAKKWFVSPHIIVRLDKSRPTQVYLLGEVTHPGLYSATKSNEESQSGSSISKPLTISDALEMGGGLKVTADLRHIHVTRLHPKQVIDVDLWKLMMDGDKKEDLVLIPGDVVYVPLEGTEFNTNDFGKVSTIKNKVRVMGAVKHPGLFPIKHEGEQIGSIIRTADGFKEPTADISIIVASTNENGSVNTRSITLHDGKITSEELVKPGDVVVKLNNFAALMGGITLTVRKKAMEQARLGEYFNLTPSPTSQNIGSENDCHREIEQERLRHTVCRNDDRNRCWYRCMRNSDGSLLISVSHNLSITSATLRTASSSKSATGPSSNRLLRYVQRCCDLHSIDLHSCASTSTATIVISAGARSCSDSCSHNNFPTILARRICFSAHVHNGCGHYPNRDHCRKRKSELDHG